MLPMARRAKRYAVRDVAAKIYVLGERSNMVGVHASLRLVAARLACVVVSALDGLRPCQQVGVAARIAWAASALPQWMVRAARVWSRPSGVASAYTLDDIGRSLSAAHGYGSALSRFGRLFRSEHTRPCGIGESLAVIPALQREPCARWARHAFLSVRNTLAMLRCKRRPAPVVAVAVRQWLSLGLSAACLCLVGDWSRSAAAASAKHGPFYYVFSLSDRSA
jgi:hypothetical protein